MLCGGKEIPGTTIKGRIIQQMTVEAGVEDKFYCFGFA
jgi:hypothetical protein